MTVAPVIAPATIRTVLVARRDIQSLCHRADSRGRGEAELAGRSCGFLGEVAGLRRLVCGQRKRRYSLWARSGRFRTGDGEVAMRRFLFPVTIFTAVCTVAAAAPAAALSRAPAVFAASGGGSAARSGQAVPGGGTASASPALSVSSQLDLRRYAAAGDRAYELGTEDGRYPAMGFHTRGEMGGIWAPPVKLLDGIWFGVNGQWIGPATRFTSGFGYVQMALPATGGVQLARTDFAPDGRRAVEVGLTLTAPSQAANVNLNVDAHSELMSAYPWGFTTPDQTTFNL